MADPQTIPALSAAQPLDPSEATGATGDSRSTVKELATQFEAMLLSKMLKDLQTSMMDGENSEDGYKAGGLGDVMTQELSLALSRAGGFGVGTMLAGAMDRTLGSSSAASTGFDPSAILASMPAAAMPSMNTDSSDATDAVTTASTFAAPMNLPRVSSAFGWRDDPIDGDNKFHKGVDLPMPVGSDVRAPADGKVVSVGEQSGYGLTVVVSHGNGIETRYAHLSGSNVKAGDAVTAGEQIARSGNTGRSTGPHLHFELTVNGQPVDPQGWASAVVSRPAAGGR